MSSNDVFRCIGIPGEMTCKVHEKDEKKRCGGGEKEEKDRETVFMDIDWRVAIKLLEVFQHTLQTPGHKRNLN